MTKITGFRNIWINLGIILLFIALAYAYLSPLLEGKTIEMDDIQHFRGMSKEMVDYREKTGEEALWTNSMFSGMPGYMISTRYKGNVAGSLHSAIRTFFPVASMIILYLVGFYVLLLSMKINRWLSVAGAIAFALSSYFIIIIGAGHVTKAYAIAYLAPVIAGVLLVFRGERWAGTLLFTFALALELHANHLQITYYGLLLLAIYGIIQLITTIREKCWPAFLKSTLFLLAGAVIAVGMNFSRLYTSWEYSKETIRGPSELSTGSENKTSGLDKDYVVQWSYGIDETLTLLIPNFKGGSSMTNPGIGSESYRTLQQRGVQNPRQTIQAVSMYHGDQPGTSGPVYVGAIIVFLFVLGLFIVQGTMKWWLLTATIISIVLSWGGNIMGLTSFLLDHLPLYNKFRAPSMTLVIAQITMPLLGFIALNDLLTGKVDKKMWLNALKWSTIATGGLALLLAVIPGIAGNFSNSADAMRYPEWLTDSMISDRKSLLQRDAFRSFLFIALTAGALYLWHFKKIKNLPLTILLGVMILIDLWTVDKRYLNNDHFIPQREAENPFPSTPADQAILADNELYYRVLPLQNPFQDARTSYHHKNVGGYHAAKLRRYQELIDHHILPEMQQMVTGLQQNAPADSVFRELPVINMLNTKYIIFDLNQTPIQNPMPLGNAWFVSQTKIAANADEEIDAMENFNPATTAIIDQRFADMVEGKSFSPLPTDRIELTAYQPNYLKYSYKSSSEQLTIFSEIYYDNGWKAFVDGEEAPHFRANYVLRAMTIPAGEHTVEFRFEPKSYYAGNTISRASSLLLVLALSGYLLMQLKASKREKTAG